MEVTREHFRAMILYDFRSGLTFNESFARLKNAFPEEAPSRTTVFNWFKEFQRGRSCLKDEDRTGRPVTATTSNHIDAVRRMIEEDRRVTYSEIRATLGIGMTAIQTILHTHLSVKKLCCRWIPHCLTEDQKKARVDWCLENLQRYNEGASKAVYNIITGDETWIYCYDPLTKQQSSQWMFQNEMRPTKIKQSRSCAKQMIASFFSRTGYICSVLLENKKTVNAEWYTTICLPTMLSKVQKKQIVLHIDNAPAHSAKLTTEFLRSAGIKLMSHPPYSPDLAPCDFFLFPTIKRKLRGIHFLTPEEAVNAFEEHVSAVPADIWAASFTEWFERMRKCVKCKGEYFEKE